MMCEVLCITCECDMYLKHLFDLLSGQVDIELVQELKDLTDAETSVSILIRLSERLLQPRDVPS